jgi:hypothetical protein
MHSEAQRLEFARGGYKQRLRPLEDLEFFQVQEESAQKLRREQQQSSDRLGIRFGPLVFTSKEQPEECREGEWI